MENGIRKEINHGPITVDKVSASEFQKEGTLTAQLRQEIETKSYYPGKAISSDMQDALFGADEFGFEEKEFISTETRIAWIDVPEGSTPEQVAAKIEALDGAVLYKVLSNKPVINNHQVYSIEEGLKTMDDYANSQAVRFGENHENAGALALDAAGNVQYRRIFFASTSVEDVDVRGEEIYASPELKAEMSEVTSDQGL